MDSSNNDSNIDSNSISIEHSHSLDNVSFNRKSSNQESNNNSLDSNGNKVKQDGYLSVDSNINNGAILNQDSKRMCESPCTETFISSPLVDSNIPWTWLTSVQHVQWVMEIIGQGFTLPPTEENVKIIQNACAIYTQWLLDSNARPYIIQAKEGKSIEQIFWQVQLI